MEEFISLFLVVFVLLLVILVLTYAVRIIPQSNAVVVERLGAYDRTLQRGLHLIVPILDRVASRVTLKENVKDFAPQPLLPKITLR